MKLKLVVTSAGAWKGKALVISRASFLIGRDPSCQLKASSDEVSRRHCLLVVDGEQVVVHDLESRNGTWVNDQRINGQAELKHKDCLRVGPLSFIVAIEREEKKPAPAEPKPAAVRPPKSPDAPLSDSDLDAASLLLEEDLEAPTAEPGKEPDPTAVASAVSVGTDTVMERLAEQPKAEEKPASGVMPAAKPKEPPKPAKPTSSAAHAVLKKYLVRRPGDLRHQD
jgi:pSer/pThr/pTyr-binding forkhead associated (FHA) protein